ncbi:MAG: sigma-70 family RNA polymerase sigma factor [Verrucomicrobia bacterium]|nr:sigma-70 family RNA polymerase sigma factor [Verrucomicrobiota bacterium]
MPAPDHNRVAAQGQTFPSTHWSVVVQAGATDSDTQQAALSELCRAYWYPIYAYVRRLGHDPEDAQDLTQGFFAQLLERNALKSVDRTKGKFRSFLLTALKNYLSDQARKARAARRGGRAVVLSIDALTETAGEDRYRREPGHNLTPDRLFEQSWSLTLLEQVIGLLRDEYASAGKATFFERLQPYLTKDAGQPTYAELAEKLGLTEEAVKKAVQRLRQRSAQLLRRQVAHTVSRPEDIEEEIRALVAIWS